MKTEPKGHPWLVARRHGFILPKDMPKQQARPSLLWDLVMIVAMVAFVALARLVVGRAFPG